MGNQQILIIVVGVIVVSIAIIIGISLFTESYNEQVKDLALLKINDLGGQANLYRKKSAEQVRNISGVPAG